MLLLTLKNAVMIWMGSSSVKLTKKPASCTISLRKGNTGLELTRSQYAARVWVTIEFVNGFYGFGFIDVDGFSHHILAFLAKIWIIPFVFSIVD